MGVLMCVGVRVRQLLELIGAVWVSVILAVGMRMFVGVCCISMRVFMGVPIAVVVVTLLNNPSTVVVMRHRQYRGDRAQRQNDRRLCDDPHFEASDFSLLANAKTVSEGAAD